MGIGPPPTREVGLNDRDKNETAQPIKCCVDRAVIFVDDNQTAVLSLSGWMVCDDADLVMLQMALPGQATVICRRVNRPDLESLASKELSAHAGFEAELPIDVAADLPELAYFIAHLKDGGTIPGSLFLPKIDWGGKQPSTGCLLPVHYACQSILRNQLEQFLRGKEQLEFTYQSEPEFSIIIDADENPAGLLAALLALQLSCEKSFEVIVVGRSAEKSVFDLLSCVSGIKTIFHSPGDNREQSLVRAANLARGRYLVFMRDTTLLGRAGLETALGLLKSDESVGAIGGRIVGPDGLLISAGRTLRADASVFNYGQAEDPWLDQFLFQRETDVVSSDLLVTSKQLFMEVGGFRPGLHYLDYHTVDYCQKIRLAKKRIIYHPDLLITRSSGLISSVIASEENRSILKEYFQRPYSSYLFSLSQRGETKPLIERFAGARRKKVLYLVDSEMMTDLHVKALMLDRLTGLLSEGLLPTCYLYGVQTISSAVRSEVPIEVELAAGIGRKELIKFLQQRQDYYDLSMVFSLESLELYCCCHDALSGPKMTALIVYDDLSNQSASQIENISNSAVLINYFQRVSHVFTASPVDKSFTDEIGDKITQVKQGVDKEGKVAEVVRKLLEATAGQVDSISTLQKR